MSDVVMTDGLNTSAFTAASMLLNNIREIKIQHDKKLKMMRMEWVGGSDMRRLRPALEQLQKLMEHLRIRIGILDLGNLPDISAYDQIWIGSHWMPKLWALPLKHMSIVIPANQVYNQQSIELLLHMARPFSKHGVQFFRNAPTAMAWLLEYEPRLPELLAEWDTNGSSTVGEPGAHYGRR